MDRGPFTLMARHIDQIADDLDPGSERGALGLIADEDAFDRAALWRLGSWAAAAVGAIGIAMLSNQSAVQGRQDQVATLDLARQNQQLQKLARETQTEANRLSAAIATLNSDRDRLFSRVASMEEGLESVTGSIGRQAAAPLRDLPPAPPTAEAPGTVQSAPVDPDRTGADAPQSGSLAGKSLLAPPESLASPLETIESRLPAASAPGVEERSRPAGELAAVAAGTDKETSEVTAVRRTEFGIDLGGANTVDGLRSLWSRLTGKNKNLTAFAPVMVVKEQSGGVQFRLVAGPVIDAGIAAKVCAAMTAKNRFCEPAVYEGQRLSLTAPAAKPQRPARKRAGARPAAAPPPAAPAEPAANQKSSSLSSFLGMR